MPRDTSKPVRDRRAAAGLCVRCGEPAHGKYRCLACRNKDRASRLKSGAIGLSAQERKVLEMRRLGRSWQAIASATGIKKMTAETVFKRAVRQDARILSEREIDALQEAYRLTQQ